jgi:hypothetical protein
MARKIVHLNSKYFPKKQQPTDSSDGDNVHFLGCSNWIFKRDITDFTLSQATTADVSVYF